MFVSPVAFSALLAVSVILLITWARLPLRFPEPTRKPLVLFFLGTLVAVFLSPEPAASWPQVKKFWVFLTLAVVYSAIRQPRDLHRVGLLWAGCGSMTALWSFGQFIHKWKLAQLAHADFYASYVGARVTGLRDHWMTFAGEQMIAALMVLALVLFGPSLRKRWWLVLAFVLICSSLAISLTRGVWLATVAGLAYLVGAWRQRWLLVLPLVLLVVAVASPNAIRQRITSLYRPHGEVDSNLHRIYCWRTGLEMVRAHPWFGLGPSEVQKQFDRYIPTDLPKSKPIGFYGHLHNTYLQYAAERGVPTLLALLWFIVNSLVTFACALRSRPRVRGVERFVLHSAIAVTLGILIEAFFEANLADSEVLAMYLAVLGMGHVAADAQCSGFGSASRTQSTKGPHVQLEVL